MLKWQGFFLSDHTTALKHAKLEDNANLHVEKRPQQSQEEVSKLLMKSYTTNHSISAQLKVVNQNELYNADIKGQVLGYDQDDGILIQGQTETFYLDGFRNTILL
ncbi:hypothetical protein IV38_GL001285 [Lactobacillus selangorensis]|uniref:DNA-directed RNA polymerase beta subunit n=1 Tax=Lactobacillus selangorensis TaxID=81857 RepID=A0A0R2FN47_9LACO|nr:hypothetical protein [Lactobacillus selangorensis]KRN29069.1 hypothetical protein IV38_GL001285 [Lactobacillus selangorensis]KRN30019.1 hypothetical protein IV40_GL002047 [Lactobacillus selangorensis]